MSHSTILVWPDGLVPPVLATRLATLQDSERRRFIRFSHDGGVGLAPEDRVTRLDRLRPDMTGAEISPQIGNA
ncbi:hypothetical protein [Falsiroseomonas sp. CW058]|uniref:hypothetical protein n=1 Tax=Falsiroseomonas sp. CW058 TaxID=3388664 RepID=UPI003D31870C